MPTVLAAEKPTAMISAPGGEQHVADDPVDAGAVANEAVRGPGRSADEHQGPDDVEEDHADEEQRTLLDGVAEHALGRGQLGGVDRDHRRVDRQHDRDRTQHDGARPGDAAGREQEDRAEREIDDSEHAAEEIEAAEDRRRPAARLSRRLERGGAGEDEQPEGPGRERGPPAAEEPEEDDHSERRTQSTRNSSEHHDDDPSEVERVLGFAVDLRWFPRASSNGRLTTSRARVYTDGLTSNCLAERGEPSTWSSPPKGCCRSLQSPH